MLLRIVLFLAMSLTAVAAGFPQASEHDFTIRNYQFKNGESLPELRIHYRTLGTIHRSADGKVDNAVLIMHGTTGSGAQFMRESFAGELFGPGQPLDAAKFFIVLPDGIGHGGSSKPSNGLRARFPKYTYDDMVSAVHRLLTEGLKVDHLRLVMGTSMGGMHTWVFAERYPNFVDAVMPFASLPVQIAGRNRMWRKIAMDAITTDPAWKNGEYTQQPRGLAIASGMLALMSSNPVIRQRELPTRDQADKFLDTQAAEYLKTADANDVLYALNASRDYDPSTQLGKIVAPLLAVNSADDLINPPELGILEREIKKVKRGTAIVIPLSDETVGHGSHTKATLWKQYLVRLLEESD
ncbi:MAG TPA: alpha/beta fold hydrolase [Terriglobales bacterium]|nr:alpha/beta fold hydrolase [Terriglobales bacterium]